MEVSIFLSQQLVEDVDRKSIRIWNVQATLLTDQIYLIDWSTLPTTVEYVFLLRTYRTLTKRVCVLGHRTRFSTCAKIKSHRICTLTTVDINEKVLELSEMPKTKPTQMGKIFAKGFYKRCMNGQYARMARPSVTGNVN